MFVQFVKNKPLWLNKLVRLNKAALYNDELVNTEIIDYGTFNQFGWQDKKL